MTTVLISLTKLIKKIVDNLSDVYITGKNISDKYIFPNSKDTLEGLYSSMILPHFFSVYLDHHNIFTSKEKEKLCKKMSFFCKIQHY